MSRPLFIVLRQWNSRKAAATCNLQQLQLPAGQNKDVNFGITFQRIKATRSKRVETRPIKFSTKRQPLHSQTFPTFKSHKVQLTFIKLPFLDIPELQLERVPKMSPSPGVLNPASRTSKNVDHHQIISLVSVSEPRSSSKV